MGLPAGYLVTVDVYLDTEGQGDIALLGVGVLFDESVVTYRQDLSSTTTYLSYTGAKAPWGRPLRPSQVDRFAGPEGLSTEIATSEEPIDACAWIDPEVVELAGISTEGFERCCRPPAFENGEARQQPPIDPAKPHLRYPPEVCARGA